MTTICYPLLVEDFGNGVGLRFTDPTNGPNFPSNAVDFGEFADEVTFIMSLYSVGGIKFPGISGNASTDTFTFTAHGLTNTTIVHLHNSAIGGMPDGLYYVVGATANTFQLSLTSGGSAVDITSTGVVDIYGDIPTAWKIGAKFQILVPHTKLGMYQQRRWADIGSFNVASMVTEGVGFGSGVTHPSPADGSFGYIADQSDGAITTPITVTRTIQSFGHGVRLVLDTPATGGSTPRMNLSINALAHIRGK